MTDLLAETQNDDPQLDPNTDYYQELVGEGKKFKDNQSLAKGKYESDIYVKTLERRLDQMKEDYTKAREENMSRAKLEELIDQLQKQPLSSEAPNANDRDNKPAIDPNEIASLIDSRMTERENARKEQANFNEVKGRLQERYGSRYQDVLKKHIEELGLTDADVNTLAKKSPKAFFKTMGLDDMPQETFNTPPRSSQRHDNFAPKGGPKRTWSYYQQMKKENPNLYYDRKIAVQMQKDAVELGDSFNDGDFYL